jgi:hypothetical protein
MPLALRPTGLSRDPNAQDWNVFDGGTQIGRIYEDKTAPTDDARWFWALQITGALEAGVETSDRSEWIAIKVPEIVSEDILQKAQKREL